MEVKERIVTARVNLLLNHPFLGTLALYLRVVDGSSTGCPTMGTDGRRLYYNKEFVEKLTDAELCGVVAHEIGHIIYQHVLEWRRASTNEFPEIFTMAQEYVVNEMVVNMFRLKLPGTPFLDSDYFGMYTEQVYEELLKKLKPRKMSKEELADMLKKGMVDEHGLGQPEGGKGADGKKRTTGAGLEKELDQLARDIKIQIGQAANVARTRGKLPGGLERLIGDILEPKISWREALAEYLSGMARDDYSWKVPNRRHIYRGVVLPSLRSESIEIAVAIDTSGSINKDDLTAFWIEVVGIMNAFQSYTLHLMGCDSAVHSYQVVEPWDEVDLDALLKGGGGTALSPVFQKLEDEGIVPRVLVYLTDGYSDYGEEPQYPVLHVIRGRFTGAPYGREVHMED